jgi:Cu/Ag efflux protein CusF
MKGILLVAALGIGLAVAQPAIASEPKPVEKKGTITLKTKIEAIDRTGRTVTLKGKNGELQTLYVEPEIKRFDELNVGDTVTFEYTEAIAVRVKKPGEPVAAASNGEPSIVRGTGAKPSGSVSRQMTGTVLVKAVDHGSGGLTFIAADGHAVSVRVEDKKLLKGVKAGDRVEVTYSNALVVKVD